MTDMGDVSYFLKIKIERNRTNRTITLSQENYCKQVLTRFGILSDKWDASISNKKMILPLDGDCLVKMFEEGKLSVKTNKPYREGLGSLMYLMLGTRPDIAFHLGVLARYADKATDYHYTQLM
jgi:hypothetical protein